MEGKITVNLAPRKKDYDREPLGALLAKAVRVTMAEKNPEERSEKSEATWICRWAIRAVAEEIIRTGEIKLPLKVEFLEAGVPNWRLHYGGDYSLN